MHEFYERMQSVFRLAGSNRNRFCKKYGYSYQTLQAYWNTDRLPPGNVLEDIAREFNVSLDALVLGRNTQELPVDNPLLARMIRFLVQQEGEELLRIEGALRMYRALTLPAGPGSAERMEALTEHLVQLAERIQGSSMSPADKQATRDMLNRIVGNVYQQDLHVENDWAELEEIE